MNPAGGWLYNSNNEPFTAAGADSDLAPEDFSPVLGIERKQTNRSWRAYKMLSEAGVLDRAAPGGNQDYVHLPTSVKAVCRSGLFDSARLP